MQTENEALIPKDDGFENIDLSADHQRKNNDLNGCIACLVICLIWKIIKIHISKIVATAVMFFILGEASIVNAVYIFGVGVILLSKRTRIGIGLLSFIWISYHLIGQIIVTALVHNNQLEPLNCHNSSAKKQVEIVSWLGFTKTGSFKSLWKHILVFLLICFELVMIIIQHCKRRINQSLPINGVLFENVERKDADKGITNCIKYFANYFFYKFGVEVCFITMVVYINILADYINFLYVIILGALLCVNLGFNRQRSAKTWPFFTLVLSILWNGQYILLIILPNNYCKENKDDNATGIIYYFVPSNYNLAGLFFVLLFMVLQWQVFSVEKQGSDNGGGDNCDIIAEVESNQLIPVADFTSVNKLDLAKLAVFYYMYWFTLSFVCVLGVTRISIFGVGYLIAAVYLYTRDLLLKPLRTINISLRNLITYNYGVLIIKNAFKIIGIVNIKQFLSGQGWLLSLIEINSLPLNDYYQIKHIDESNSYEDVACFVILLIQIRICKSHYFRHSMRQYQDLKRRVKSKNFVSKTDTNFLGWRLQKQKTDRVEKIRKYLQEIKDLKEVHSLCESEIKNNEDLKPDEDLRGKPQRIAYQLLWSFRSQHKTEYPLHVDATPYTTPGKPRSSFHTAVSYYTTFTEYPCYILMILIHLLNRTLLSLVFPLLLFWWGLISSPRPSKRFWSVVLFYTEVVILAKDIFELINFNGNITSNDGIFILIGLDKANDYAGVEVALLVTVLFHIFILKIYKTLRIDPEIKELEEENTCSTKIGYETLETEQENEQFKEENTSSTNVKNETLETEQENEQFKEENTFSTNVKEDHKKNEVEERKLNKSKNMLQEVLEFIAVETYFLILICDFITLLFIFIGFPNLVHPIPVTLFGMFLVQIFLMIIERIMYINKAVKLKCGYYCLFVLVFHILIFLIVPYTSQIQFYKNWAAIVIYSAKCIYFLLSAYQIRLKYSMPIFKHFLTTKYNRGHQLIYTGFLEVPYLWDVKLLLDWGCSKTSLTFKSWRQTENIFAKMFQLKCNRNAEKDRQTEKISVPKDKQRCSWNKCAVCCGVLFLICMMSCPLLVFSLLNQISDPNPPTEATVAISIGGFKPIFEMSVQSPDILELTKSEYKELLQSVDKNREATGFLGNFKRSDITRINFDGNSGLNWDINYPSQQRLIKYLNNTESPELHFSISFIRTPCKLNCVGEIKNKFTSKMNWTMGNRLDSMIQKGLNTSVAVSRVFPRYMIREKTGIAKPVTQLLSDTGFSNITLKFMHHNANHWWQIEENYYELLVPTIPDRAKIQTKTYITVYTFNERLETSLVKFFIEIVIFLIWIKVVLNLWKCIRGSMSSELDPIAYHDLPQVDKMLQMCDDIYLMREKEELNLETELYEQLTKEVENFKMMQKTCMSHRTGIKDD